MPLQNQTKTDRSRLALATPNRWAFLFCVRHISAYLITLQISRAQLSQPANVIDLTLRRNAYE